MMKNDTKKNDYLKLSFDELLANGPSRASVVARNIGLSSQHARKFLEQLVESRHVSKICGRTGKRGRTYFYRVVVEEYSPGCGADIELLNVALKIEKPQEMMGRIYLDGILSSENRQRTYK